DSPLRGGENHTVGQNPKLERQADRFGLQVLHAGINGVGPVQGREGSQITERTTPFSCLRLRLCRILEDLRRARRRGTPRTHHWCPLGGLAGWCEGGADHVCGGHTLSL